MLLVDDFPFGYAYKITYEGHWMTHRLIDVAILVGFSLHDSPHSVSIW